MWGLKTHFRVKFLLWKQQYFPSIAAIMCTVAGTWLLSATLLFAANGLKVDITSVPQLLQRYKDVSLFTGRDLAEQGAPTNLVFCGRAAEAIRH